MMAMEGSNMVVLDLDDLKDPATGRTRVRTVNINSDHYRIALKYQMRITKADLACEGCCQQIAEAAGLTPEQLRDKFGPVAI